MAKSEVQRIVAFVLKQLTLQETHTGEVIELAFSVACHALRLWLGSIPIVARTIEWE
jgi:hypothetical protein